MLNSVRTQENLRQGGNRVNNFNRSILKEPVLPTFVPGASNKFDYAQGDLYWWPPASLKERPSTLSPNIPQATQTKFEAFNPRTHSKTPTIIFEEDPDAFTTKSTETTTEISQNDDSEAEVNFGEYFPVQDVTRSERGNNGEFSKAPGDETLLRNQDYRYNILVLPDHISNLDDQNKIYFEPKDIFAFNFDDTYKGNDSSKAELRNNVEKITLGDDFKGQISTETKLQKDEPIGNEDRAYTGESYHEEQPHVQQYHYDRHHEDTSYSQQNQYSHHQDTSNIQQNHYDQHHEEPSHDLPYQYESHARHPHEQGEIQHDPGQQTSYAYNYHANGYPAGPIFSKHENSDGFLTRGEYSVKLPDGRTQTVSYSVKGEGGFTVNVRYSGNGVGPYDRSFQEKRSQIANQKNSNTVDYIPHKSFQAKGIK